MNKVLIPMIRQTFPELLINDLVSVQPMSGPTGVAFFMEHLDENKERLRKEKAVREMLPASEQEQVPEL